MLVLELLGLLGMPVVSYFAVTQQWRGRVLLPVLFVLLGVLLYAGGDMHGWRLVWYVADWLLVLSILQAAHSPALAPYYEAKLWDRIPRVEADPNGIGQDLLGWLRDPRLSHPGMTLKLDLSGDLLVAVKLNGRWGRRRYAALQACPHCALESLVSGLVSEEPVKLFEEYRTGISKGEGCAMDIYYSPSPSGVHMQVLDANRPPPPAGTGCTVHAR
ncbi:hypothetical protein [Streptomyces olivochromogenes]|uniref:hypothetical protein n=1 Tax=Streptomyces olivochromogenes TaxID=1963 RepID=UPI001F3725CE|nr:hypothetical protein [Streptomyces olivochromogenes]MCF3134428.1 hypothetical protein [Streptomyces olivochromogenes]